MEEISGRIGGLSADDLMVVRDHEERTKNRETVLEQLDRRIRVALRERLVRRSRRNAFGRSIVDLVTLSQIANPILQTIFIAVIGIGYYYTVRATWATVREMRAEHTAGGGRPLITVSGTTPTFPT